MRKSSIITISIILTILSLILTNFVPGVIQPVYACYTWAVGQRVGLKGGTQIRTGSGLGYSVHTTLPADANNWQVDIIGGPRSADGQEWWDISRQNIDGGGTGWVYKSQAGWDLCGSNPPPSNWKLVLIQDLSVSNSSPQTNQDINGNYKVRNTGGIAVTLEYLGIQGRLNGDINGQSADFAWIQNLTLQPGQEYTYSTNRSFQTTGSWRLRPNFKPQGGNWSDVQRDNGSINEVWINVQNPPPPPSGNLQLTSGMVFNPTSPVLGQNTNVKFTATNVGTGSMTLGHLGVKCRRTSDQANYDFAWMTNVTLASGQSYAYDVNRVFDQVASYSCTPNYEVNGTWNDIKWSSGSTNYITITVQNPPPPSGNIQLTGGMVFNPTSPTPGQNTNVKYTATNAGNASMTFGHLGVKCRRTSDQANYDFAWMTNVTLSSGQSYSYDVNRAFDQAGTYSCTPNYEINGTWNDIKWSNGSTNYLTLSVQNTTPPVATYSISGQVLDKSSLPIEGVVVSDGQGNSRTTGSNGRFQFTGLKAGSYTLTPTKGSYSFMPPSTPVTISVANVTDTNFVGATISGYCAGTTTATNPILLVTGWGGSKNSLAEDENLRYFGGVSGKQGYLEMHGYKEGCNLFYAQATSPYFNQEKNGEIIRSNMCRFSLEVEENYPNWSGYFDIIAHSYGGLRARAFLENPKYYPSVCDSLPQGSYKFKGVTHLITMGSPHGGEWGDLPLAYLIGLTGLGTGNVPAIFEMAPPIRSNQNKNSYQPKDNITYYLISGDARPQVDYSNWPFPTVRNDPNDLAVHRWSAHVLMSMPDNYRNLQLLYTNDAHGVSDSKWVSWLKDLYTYVNPQTTFDRCIWPIIQGGSNQCSAPITQSIPDESEETNSSVVNYITSLSVDQPTQDIAMVDINSGTLSSNQTTSGTFKIESTGPVDTLFAWTDEILTLSLTNPSGHVIVSGDAGVTILDYGVGLGRTIGYHFDNAAAGTWSYKITAGFLQNPATYRLGFIPSVPVTIAGTAPSWMPYASPIKLSASVKYSGVAITGSTITASITQPNGISEIVSLYDDGAHADGIAGDGVFAVNYTNTNLGGLYGVLFTGSGVYNGKAYTRTSVASFAIAPNTASLGSQYADQAIDRNNDGSYDVLDISIPVVVSKAGSFTVSADLYAGTTFIAHLSKLGMLIIGSQLVTLEFNGFDVYLSKTNGPYTLRNVMLTDETTVPILIEAKDNVYNTKAYDFNQFIHKLLYLPVINR